MNSIDTSEFISFCEKIWNDSPDVFPLFTTCYSPESQRQKEALFSEYHGKFKKVQKEIKSGKRKPDDKKFFNAFSHFMQDIYDYSDEALSIILHPDMIRVSRSFFEKARAFDPALKQEEIFQGLRNVWIMNGLQLLLDIRVEITPSVFAYSLLYPYSDNILDDPSVSFKEKVSFSQRFEQRLAGTGAMADNYRERKISELVGMIELQYPRNLFPEVHASLRAIHSAQTKSLQLVRKGTDLSAKEVLSIGFDKGGSSVLADGFLVAGQLSPEIQQFFFGFGVWLQMADDIQDIPEDILSDTVTLFTLSENQEKLTSLTNKTFHFGRKILKDIKYCQSEISIPFSKVILQSIELMLIQSAGMNEPYFRSEYCKHLEQYSPVGFAFLKEAKKKGSPGRFKLITQYMDSNL
jgi:hypothetical protein